MNMSLCASLYVRFVPISHDKGDQQLKGFQRGHCRKQTLSRVLFHASSESPSPRTSTFRLCCCHLPCGSHPSGHVSARAPSWRAPRSHSSSPSAPCSCPTRDPSSRHTPWAGTPRRAHPPKTFSDAGLNRKTPQSSPSCSHRCFVVLCGFFAHQTHDHEHLLIFMPVTPSARSISPYLRHRLIPIFVYAPLVTLSGGLLLTPSPSWFGEQSGR